MLALLVIAALFTGGALFVKFKLEGLRDSVQKEIEDKTGARLQVGSVLVNGLRGLRIDDVEVALDSKTGPSLSLKTPAIYIFINVVELLYGNVSVDRIQLDNAKIQISRPEANRWVSGSLFEVGESPAPFDVSAFRFLGENCTLELENVIGGTHLTVNDFKFDVARLTGSPDISAKVSGRLSPTSTQETKVDLRFSSIEDFDLRIASEEVTAEDLAAFFPATQQFIRTGTVLPQLRVSGYPGMTLVLAFEAGVKNLVVRNQPEFIQPLEGRLTGVAAYDAHTKTLTFTTAKGESQQLSGRLDGTVSFEGPYPAFDLNVEATRLPIMETIDYAIKERLSEYGTLELKLEDPAQVKVLLQGTTEAPVIAVEGKIDRGQFVFKPKTPDYPEADLSVGAMALAWRSDSTKPVGSLTVVDGKVSYSKSSLKVEKVSGTLTVDDTGLSVDPLNMDVTGNPFVGSLKYDFASQKLEVVGNGRISEVEKTPLFANSEDVALRGAVGVQGRLVKAGNKYTIDGELDAGQAEFGYQWWFLKPVGVGGRATEVHLEIIPNKSITFSGNADMASSQFVVKGRSDRQKTGWKMKMFQVNTDALDVETVGKCIRIPYKIHGGKATEGSFIWSADKDNPENWQFLLGLRADTIQFVPEGGDEAFSGEGVRATAAVTKSEKSTGALTIDVGKASTPQLGKKAVWFLPLDKYEDKSKRDPEEKDDERAWTFHLKGENVEVPPWKGARFAGEAYSNPKESGLKTFSSEIVGGGRVEGMYHRIQADNAYEIELNWKGIPSSYLIEQMQYPNVLTGTSTGNVKYYFDNDDPSTLKGQGSFEVRPGQFSADYLVSKLEGRLREQIPSLPISLKFDSLKTAFDLEGDHVRTKDLQLNASGIRVSGDGVFVTGGDMDYNLKVALSPDLAEKIPALRDNLNVQGLRMAQQDLELAFKVKGPVFQPRGEVAELPPVGVTLVSSALEATSDAMRVIDIPRKILVDLLRIGSGIVGAPASGRGGEGSRNEPRR